MHSEKYKKGPTMMKTTTRKSKKIVALEFLRLWMKPEFGPFLGKVAITLL
jgi:hypothetical protein